MDKFMKRMRKNKKVRQYSALGMFAAAGAFSVMFVGSVAGGEIDRYIPNISAPEAKEKVEQAERNKDSVSANVRVTWFGRECGTTWCNMHKDMPRVHEVAVNVSKFGYPKQVYIPKWDATYTVIEKPYTNTDGNTDLDIWCLDDTKCQQQVGQEKNLLVKFIY